jgi:uncharacterized protein (TIGR02271 family)
MMKEKKHEKVTHHTHEKKGDLNPDPITGTPGAHPIGTGLGAGAAGAAGAAIGAMGGPVGAVVGGAVGAVVGGLAGKGAAEVVNPTAEDEYWRTNYTSRSYVEKGKPYETYRPAYEFGWTNQSRFAGKKFDECELDLKRDWEKTAYSKSFGWDKARYPIRDAFDRLGTRMTRSEEELQVQKRQVSAGEVAVKKDVVTENVAIPVTKRREEVDIERRPVTGVSPGTIGSSKDEIRVPITEERIEVTKRPVVKEEIVVKKRPVEEQTEVRGEIRKEKIDIDRRERPLRDDEKKPLI